MRYLQGMNIDATRDPRVRRYHAPVRVLASRNAVRAETLLESPLKLQSTLGQAPTCRLEHGEGGGFLLLDFGRELHGSLRVVVGGTPDNKPVRLRVRFGESVGEAMADPFPIHGHAIHDHQISVPWLGSHEVGSTGFRFVRIDTVDPGSHLELAAACAVSLMHDDPRVGYFRSSDPLLERIWSVGADTVHLCMQELLWDGIKRDRLVWIGDMHPETSVISCVFGAHPIVPASLDFVRDQTPLPGWMNGISSYSLWWLVIQRDWWLHHGDMAYLARQRSYLHGLAAQVAACVGEDGRERLDGWRFLDWPTNGREEPIHGGLQGLCALAVGAAIELLEALGDGGLGLAERCRAAASRLKGHVPGHGGSKQAAALLALGGLQDPAALNAEVLARDPLSGVSTFYGSYVLRARAAAGDVAGALAVIRSYWGAMLERGATSFWEDFDLGWLANAGRIDEPTPAGLKDLHGDFGDHCYKGFRHSLCHGWAAGPTAWLSAVVLGCVPLEPGCRRLAVKPRLGDLSWAEGGFPTPLGPVLVRHERAGDKVETEVTAPAGIAIERAAP